MAARFVTWNVQGNRGLDIDGAAAVIQSLRADVVCLQEVQWAQHRALRRSLGWRHSSWAFKHWSLRHPAEGHAVLAAAPVRLEATTISRGYQPFAWQRRIAQIGRADALAGAVVVNTHLGSGSAAGERAEQVQRVLDRVRSDVVVGDLNESAGAALDALRAAGLRDAWASANGDDAPCLTNWSQSDRSRPPDQRLDWVWLSPVVRVLEAELGDWHVTAPLSDHVPLAVTLDLAT